MAKIVLPVRHYVRAKYGRNRSQKMLNRLDRMSLEHAIEDELDLAANILDDLAKHDLTMFGINKRELEGAVSRWQVRPVARSLER